jgi:regulator of sigma E protease
VENISEFKKIYTNEDIEMAYLMVYKRKKIMDEKSRRKFQKFMRKKIIERDKKALDTVSWLNADASFDDQVNWSDIQTIAKTVGTDHLVAKKGDFVLLKPITPKTIVDFDLPEDKKALLAKEVEIRQRQIEEIEDPESKRLAQMAMNEQTKKLLLGIGNVQDRRVEYNPIPTDAFMNVSQEIVRTLGALFTGSLSPKWVSGPVGIVQVVHDRSMVSFKEALFWMGAISLNLGLLNLLPIPMLDGGTIVFSLIELVTRRRVPPKVLERLIIPFAVLLVAFFVFLTYNDLSRLLGGFWR